MNQEITHKDKRFGKVLAGLFVVGIGVLLLFRKLGYLFPEWLFTWPSLLVAIGIFIGLKHNFRNAGWLLFVIIGGVFLLNIIFPGTNLIEFFWPLFIIAIGLIIVFKPRRRHHWKNREHWKNWKKSMDYQHHYEQAATNREDFIDSVSLFGGVRKVVVSKSFKGGDVVCIFGGAEIDFSQADINGQVVLEITQVFGGTKIIIPSHWELRSEMMTAIMSGIEDKRTKHDNPDPSKVLVIKGTSVFGGIDIVNY